MTHVQQVWTVIIAAQAVVNIPALIHLFRKPPMPVYPELTAVIAELDASIAALPAKIAAAVAASDVIAAQDKTDSVAAVQAAADALKAAVGA